VCLGGRNHLLNRFLEGVAVQLEGHAQSVGQVQWANEENIHAILGRDLVHPVQGIQGFDLDDSHGALLFGR
jgi:hypothetical protein